MTSGRRASFVILTLQAMLVIALLVGNPVFNSSVQAQPAASQGPDNPGQNENAEAVPEDDEKVQQLPLLEELELPTVKELLQGPKIDWIVLFGKRVLQVPAIWPRPQHLDELKLEQEQMLDDRPNKESPQHPEWLQEYQELFYIYLSVDQEGIEDDYRLHTRFVEVILYHEELCLRKVDELLKTGDLVTARELLTAVKRWETEANKRRKTERLETVPWPGLLDRERDLFRIEMNQAIQKEELEHSFSLLKRRYVIDPADPALHRFAGLLLDEMIPDFVNRHDYRRARYYLRQTQNRFPNHDHALEWTNHLIQLAQQQMQEAEQASRQDARKASLLAQHSLTIWPFSSLLIRRAQTLQEQYQTLNIGWVETEVDTASLLRNLQHTDWFHVDTISEGYPRFQSAYIETWIPKDLGREIHLKFRGQATQEVTEAPGSQQFAKALTLETLQRTSNQRDLYSNYITAIHADSPDELQFRFHSTTPHPYAFLAAIVRPREQSVFPELKHQRFQPISENIALLPFEEQRPRFQRVKSHSRSKRRVGIAEVSLNTYDSSFDLLQDLLRDHLHVVPEVPLDYVTNLRQDQRFRILEYQVPKSLMLRFAFHGQLSRQSELRMAMYTILDRNDLKEHYHSSEQSGSEFVDVVDSICPSSSHARSASQLVQEFDETTARALAILLNRLPDYPATIVLKCPKTTQAQRVAKRIQERWRILGIETTIITSQEDSIGNTNAEQSGYDVELVELTMAAPHIQLPELLSNQPRITVEQLESFPPYIRSILLNLEISRSWKQIDVALNQLQDQLIINSWFLPILESRRFMTQRKELRNVPDRLIEPFDTIDQWAIEPVISTY